ncbi:MAG: hypothetical protein ABI543_09815 [Ignavibacteria bacterium]
MSENNDDDRNESVSLDENSYVNSIMEIVRINELEPTPDFLTEKKKKKPEKPPDIHDKIWMYDNGKLL